MRGSRSLLSRDLTSGFAQLCDLCLFSVLNLVWVLRFWQKRVAVSAAAFVYIQYCVRDFIAVSMRPAGPSLTTYNYTISGDPLQPWSARTYGLSPPRYIVKAQCFSVPYTSPGLQSLRGVCSVYSVSAGNSNARVSLKGRDPFFLRTPWPSPNTPIKSRLFVAP